MRKIILVISLVLFVALISGCFTSAKEPIPDPILGTWHRQSYSTIPFLGDIQQISWAPNTMTFNSDGTCTDGSWKWTSNNSYEVYSKQSLVPNGTISLDNNKMYLSRWSFWPPGTINATYTR
jgi:hypothetical protein